MSWNPKHSASTIALTWAICLFLWAENANAQHADSMSFAAAGLSCACFEGSELQIKRDLPLSAPACQCAFAQRARKDLASVVGKMPLRHDFDRMKVALALEDKFIPLSPEYERLFHYDAKRYRWFLENVRCVCSGCKATVYFSNCQLSCSPAIVYKRRARVWLALGFSTDELIDYYLAEYNRGHAAREQVSREWLLPRRQKKRGWMVPAVLIIGAMMLLAGVLRRIVAKSASPVTVERADVGADGVAAVLDPSARSRLLDELDDLED